MHDEPRRGPGRPRTLAVPMGSAPAPDVAPVAVEQVAEASSPTARRRRAKVGGHSMKLSAPAREGYERRWFNDDGNRIAEADELGYDFVLEQGIQTSGPGSRVSRLVGTKPNGDPLHAFLMETPRELYAQGESERIAETRKVDRAILDGRDATGELATVPGSELYGQGSIQSDR